MVRLSRVLLIASEAIGAVVAQCDCLLHDFLECFLEHTLGYAPATNRSILLDHNCRCSSFCWLISLVYRFYLLNRLCSSMWAHWMRTDFATYTTWRGFLHFLLLFDSRWDLQKTIVYGFLDNFFVRGLLWYDVRVFCYSCGAELIVIHRF